MKKPPNNNNGNIIGEEIAIATFVVDDIQEIMYPEQIKKII